MSKNKLDYYLYLASMSLDNICILLVWLGLTKVSQAAAGRNPWIDPKEIFKVSCWTVGYCSVRTKMLTSVKVKKNCANFCFEVYVLFWVKIG